jgi:peptidoglycan/LPS O-acetylase OafA/YrhL
VSFRASRWERWLRRSSQANIRKPSLPNWRLINRESHNSARPIRSRTSEIRPLNPARRSYVISPNAILDYPELDSSVISLESPLEASAPDPAPETVRKPGMPALTGLRTILAVGIMLFHFTPPHMGFLAPVIGSSYVFVGFFFLISGFVIAYNYADRPELSKRRFYIARFSRIYPVYALVLLLSIPFLAQEWTAHTPHDFYLGLVLTPFALQGWNPTLATFWNTVAWTVPAELMLYAVFPFLLIFLSSQAKRIATPRRLIAAILIVWLIGITPHIAYTLFNPDHLAQPADRFTEAYWLSALKRSPPAYFCTFTAGVLLARLYAVLELNPLRRFLLGLAAFAGLALFFAFAVDRVPYILIHGALLLPLFATLLLALTGPNPIASIFASRPLVLFGRTTFSLYLLHFNVFQMIHLYHLPERLHVARFDPWISYAAILLLALAVHNYFENPARRFVLSLTGGGPQTPAR